MSGETLQMQMLPYKPQGVTERFDEYENDAVAFTLTRSEPN